MKFRKLMICILFASYSVISSAYSCPKAIDNNPKALALYDWLLPLEGQFEMKGCQVELHMCDYESRSEQAPIAELFIQDDLGREFYLPITVENEAYGKIKTKIYLSSRTAHYQRTDRFYESEMGRTEVYRLEFRKDSKDRMRLKSIDLGVYGTNIRLDQPNGNQSHWYNCGE